MPQDRKPRIIFNDDTCSLRVVAPPHTPDKVGAALEHLRGSQVDWLCWCLSSGAVAYSWRAEAIENAFDLSAANAGGVLANPGNLMLSLDGQGIDYLPLLIEKCREAGIAFLGSFRMNDCHHKSRPQGMLAGEFWRSHPDYRLWEVTDGRTYYNAALNYAVPEVRERMLAAIGEVLERYDVDGLELDWCRNPYALQPSEAWARRDVMTRFTRRVRAMTDAARRAKDRRIRLVARVPHDEERLRRAGLDARAWVRHGLVDVLVTSCLVNDYNVDVAAWLDLCREHGVWHYHSVEAGPAANAPAHNHVVPETVEEGILRARAAAHNILAQGSDGVYIFNYPCRLFEHKRTPEEFARLSCVLAELGSLKALRATPRQYTFWKDMPVQLESWRPAQYHQTLTFQLRGSAPGKGRGEATIRFLQVAERNPHVDSPQDPPACLPPDWVRYCLNGQPVDAEQITRICRPARKIEQGFELRPHEEIRLRVPARRLKPGENTLAFHIPKAPEEHDPYVYIYQLTVDTGP